MFKNHRTLIIFGLASFGLGLLAGNLVQLADVAEAQSADRAFELRTYTAHPGRLQELHARFADHTLDLFERHGMTNVSSPTTAGRRPRRAGQPSGRIRTGSASPNRPAATVGSCRVSRPCSWRGPTTHPCARPSRHGAGQACAAAGRIHIWPSATIRGTLGVLWRRTP